MARKLIGEGNEPLICVPLLGNNREIMGKELSLVLGKKPDLLEWRADFFQPIGDMSEVIAVANEIKDQAGEIPVIFTLRAVREGGQPIALTEDERLRRIIAVCEETAIEYVDYELSNRLEMIRELRRVASGSGTKWIASYHNFDFTPELEVLIEMLHEASLYDADVMKCAVMSNNLDDVLSLLKLTHEAKNYIEIPFISIAMGQYGALTRMFGGVFGSAVTFAKGEKSSAPGQMPIEDLRSVLDILRKL